MRNSAEYIFLNLEPQREEGYRYQFIDKSMYVFGALSNDNGGRMFCLLRRMFCQDSDISLRKKLEYYNMKCQMDNMKC